jgi:hypothetical protein
MRLSADRAILLIAVIGLAVIAATDQVVPAVSSAEARQRLWLVARASGVTAYLLLAAQVMLGMAMSHPENLSRWKISKLFLPWHANLSVYLVAFLGAHVVNLVLDPYAGVGVKGALVPGLSEYRSVPVALGSLAMYAGLIFGLTARYTQLLPAGLWLKVHRISLVVFILAWAHGILAGTDTAPLLPFYILTGVPVLWFAASRYWFVRKARAGGKRPVLPPDGAAPPPTAHGGPDREPAPARSTLNAGG